MKRTIYQLTPESTRNPFFTGLRHELEALDWTLHYSLDLDAVEQACESAPENSVVHLHQLEALYQDRDENKAWERARRLVNFLISVRMKGVPIVHTFHNRRRHDTRQASIEDFTLRMLAVLVTKVVVLGESAKEALDPWKAYGADLSSRVDVVPHQNYVDAYGPRIDPPEARARLALRDDEDLYLCLGDLKPYKGHGLIIEGFRRAGDQLGRLLLVGGGAPGLDYVKSIEAELQSLGPSRSRLVAQTIEEDQVSLWLSAADFAVFGFRDILMSGSVMLALSYGLPVVIPRMGCLPEYVEEGVQGAFYEPQDPESLGHALRRISQTRPSKASVIDSVSRWDRRSVSAKLSATYGSALARRFEA